MHFNGRFVLNLIYFAGKQGADVNELVALSGLSEEDLCEEDRTVGPEVYNRVMETAIATSGDPHFGLHAGESLNLTAVGLIGQITQSSQTVRQALEYCCEFANLGCSALPMTMNKEGSDYIVSIRPDPLWLKQSETAAHQTADGVMAFTLREYQSLIRKDTPPKAIRFMHDGHGNRPEYARLFGDQVEFDQPYYAFVFTEELIEQPVVTSNYDLLRTLVDFARKKEQEIQSHQGFYHQVRRTVINLIKPEFPTIEQVAASFNLSVRSLQRKLKEDGKSFSDVIDELRLDFAQSYLRDESLTLADISYLLGYSESSAFVRAFGRWTGQTPNEFRSVALKK